MSESCCQWKCDFQWSKGCKMWFQWNANDVCIMGELCKCKWNTQDSAAPCPLLQQSSLIHNNPDFIVLHRWSNEMNRMWKRSPWQQESLFEKLVVWRLRPGLINASQSQESLYYETLYVHERANWIIIDNVDKLIEKPGMWELDRDWSIQGFMTIRSCRGRSFQSMRAEYIGFGWETKKMWLFVNSNIRAKQTNVLPLNNHLHTAKMNKSLPKIMQNTS